MSPFPWTISLCTGEAIQFLVKDSSGNIVMMSEMYDLADFRSFLTVFQRNPEIRIDPDLEKNLLERRYEIAERVLEGLDTKTVIKYLREHDSDLIKAGEAARADLDQSYRLGGYLTDGTVKLSK